MAYKRPIIKEIFATVRLRESTLGSEEFFDIVPRLRERGFSKVQIGSEPTPVVPPPPGEFEHAVPVVLEANPPRVRCWTEDSSRLIQLGNDQVVANHVVTSPDQYLGWDAFKRVFDIAIDETREAVNGFGAQTIELGTVDELDVPTEGFTLGKFLHCGGNRMPRWYHETSAACDISMGLGFLKIDGFNSRFKVRVRQRDDRVNMRIDSNFSMLTASRALDEVLEELHKQSSTHFEELITDSTRNDVMGGEIK